MVGSAFGTPPLRRHLARLLVTAALAAATLANPHELEAQQLGRLVVEHADQTQRLAQGDTVSYYLDGNVRARRGDLRLTAEHVVLLDWLGLMDASGNVHLWDPEKELYANHATYTDSTDVAVATGNVQVIDRKSGSQLKSQQAVYDRRAQLLTATQQPEMILVVRDSAPAAPVDSAPQPIHVWGEQIQIFGDGDQVVAIGNVLIQRGRELTAKADSVALVRNQEDRIHLRQEPQVETGRFYVQADDIDVVLAEGAVREMVAWGRARALSLADSIPQPALTRLGELSDRSWIAGDTLRFAFEEDVLRTVRATGDARSLNYTLESSAGDATTWALSYLMAGTITLRLDEAGQAVERVLASRDGKGVYRTVALTAGEPEAPPADSARASADSIPAPGDSIPIPADSLAAPADSARTPAPADSAPRPAEPVQASSTPARRP